MKASLLIKVLQNMHTFCKNRTLSLTFYETPVEGIAKVTTKEEFNDNLPPLYYTAIISSTTRTLCSMQRSSSVEEEDQVLSRELSFDFSELLKLNTVDLTIHKYQENFPFSKTSAEQPEDFYKTYSQLVKSESTFFIDLFELMGNAISLVLEGNGKQHLAHYIDSKIYIVDANDWALTVKITDFHSIARIFPDFTLIDFHSYPGTLTARSYLNKLESACKAGALQFVKD